MFSTRETYTETIFTRRMIDMIDMTAHSGILEYTTQLTTQHEDPVGKECMN